MSDYQFKRLDKTNIKDLLFLYKHAFNASEDLDFIQKKYNTSFVGITNVGFIAYHILTNEPAAFYGVFPIQVEINETQLTAAQSGDTMTHPNHRGKGLFITLAKMTYDLAKELGVEFVFGFPNDNSYPGFVNKLNWQHYSNVNHYKIAASSIPIDKLAKRYSLFQPILNLFIPKPLSIAAAFQFPNSLKHQNNSYGTVCHHQQFYNYKTYYPNFVIELEGVKCWLKVDGRLWVGDIEFCNEDKFMTVVNALVNYAKRKFCSSVQFSVFENSSYDTWLKKKFKAHSSIAAGCLNLSMNYKPEKFAYQAVDFDTF